MLLREFLPLWAEHVNILEGEIKMRLKGYGWPLILTCFPLVSGAVEDVTVLEVSSTQKSIMIDRGTELDHIRPGQRARFYVQQSTDVPHMTFIAEGEAVKVHSNFSYWYLKNVDNAKLLKKGQRLEFISDAEILSGRREVEVRERSVVLAPDESADDFKEQSKRGVPERLLKKKDGYEENEQKVQTEIPRTEDLRETSYGTWDEESSQSTSDFEKEIKAKKSTLLTPKKKAPEKKPSAVAFEKEIYDSSSVGVINKINSYSDPLDALYGERKTKNGDGTGNTSSSNVFKLAKEDEGKSRAISDADLSKIDKDDPRWSEEMSDKQLRRFFVESNIEREITRQRFAIGNAPNNEIIFRYVMGVADKTNAEENSNRGTAQAIDTAYEFHLLRATEALKDWTLEGGFSWGYNFYNTEPYNARASEQVFHAGLNYYFYNGPSAINSVLWHVGAGMRYGSASLISENFLQEYGYQVSSTYGQLGVKYRFSGGDYDLDVFRVGFGINALMSVERTTLSSNQPIMQYDVSGSIVTTDTKFALGLSIFF